MGYGLGLSGYLTELEELREVLVERGHYTEEVVVIK